MSRSLFLASWIFAAGLPVSVASADQLPQEMPVGTEASVAPTPREAARESTETVEPAEHHRPPMHVYPSARVALGAGWLRGDAHLVFDVALGIHAFRHPGFGTGVLLGMTRRPSGPEWTAFTLGVPVEYVTHHARFAFGVRPDLLVGRANGDAMVGGRASVFVAYRQSVFVEGGYERLRIDGSGVDGYRVVAGIDLGVVLANLFVFGGAVL